VRRNLASFTQGAAVCQTELIPTEVQIQAVTTLEERVSMSTVPEGEGFFMAAVEIHATRKKE
jgi:hypothetical protein